MNWSKTSLDDYATIKRLYQNKFLAKTPSKHFRTVRYDLLSILFLNVTQSTCYFIKVIQFILILDSGMCILHAYFNLVIIFVPGNSNNSELKIRVLNGINAYV